MYIKVRTVAVLIYKIKKLHGFPVCGRGAHAFAQNSRHFALAQTTRSPAKHRAVRWVRAAAIIGGNEIGTRGPDWNSPVVLRWRQYVLALTTQESIKLVPCPTFGLVHTILDEWSTAMDPRRRYSQLFFRHTRAACAIRAKNRTRPILLHDCTDIPPSCTVRTSTDTDVT